MYVFHNQYIKNPKYVCTFRSSLCLMNGAVMRLPVMYHMPAMMERTNSIADMNRVWALAAYPCNVGAVLYVLELSVWVPGSSMASVCATTLPKVGLDVITRVDAPLSVTIGLVKTSYVCLPSIFTFHSQHLANLLLLQPCSCCSCLLSGFFACSGLLVLALRLCFWRPHKYLVRKQEGRCLGGRNRKVCHAVLQQDLPQSALRTVCCKFRLSQNGYGKKTWYTSRFVRVILAQRPC